MSNTRRWKYCKLQAPVRYRGAHLQSLLHLLLTEKCQPIGTVCQRLCICSKHLGRMIQDWSASCRAISSESAWQSAFRVIPALRTHEYACKPITQNYKLNRQVSACILINLTWTSMKVRASTVLQAMHRFQTIIADITQTVFSKTSWARRCCI